MEAPEFLYRIRVFWAIVWLERSWDVRRMPLGCFCLANALSLGLMALGKADRDRFSFLHSPSGSHHDSVSLCRLFESLIASYLFIFVVVQIHCTRKTIRNYIWCWNPRESFKNISPRAVFFHFWVISHLVSGWTLKKKKWNRIEWRWKDHSCVCVYLLGSATEWVFYCESSQHLKGIVLVERALPYRTGSCVV